MRLKKCVPDVLVVIVYYLLFTAWVEFSSGIVRSGKVVSNIYIYIYILIDKGSHKTNALQRGHLVFLTEVG